MTMNQATIQTAPTQYEQRLASLALAMRLTPAAAIYLPAYVEIAARKLDTSETDFVRKLETIRELSEYVASVCTGLAAKPLQS
jgi:hypothetical protein